MVSAVSAHAAGVVRATIFTFAPGCLDSVTESEDGNGKLSSSMRKKPMKPVSSIWFAASTPAWCWTWTIAGWRIHAMPPLWFGTGTRTLRAQSSSASFFMSTP